MLKSYYFGFLGTQPLKKPTHPTRRRVGWVGRWAIPGTNPLGEMEAEHRVQEKSKGLVLLFIILRIQNPALDTLFPVLGLTPQEIKERRAELAKFRALRQFQETHLFNHLRFLVGTPILRIGGSAELTSEKYYNFGDM